MFNVHLAHGHADAKDGISTQLVLVVGAIQGQLKKAKLQMVKNGSRLSQGQFDDTLLAHHKLVNLLLLNRVHALRHNLWGYQVVHIVHSLWRQKCVIFNSDGF